MKKHSHQDILNWYLTFEEMLAANPQLAPIYEHIRSTAEDKESVVKMHKLHFNLRLNLFFHQHITKNLLICINAYQNKVLGVPFVKEGDPSQLADRLPPLMENGYTYLPTLDAVKVKEMYDYLEAQPVHADPKKRTEDNLVHRDTIRENHHVGILSERTVTNCPHFLDIVLSPDVLQLVEKMIGATPTLISLDSWWSFANREAPTEAQLYHMDIDDHRFVKLFIYLTDVDMDSGPHAYVPGTHMRRHIIDILESKVEEYPEIINWYVTQLRKTDEEVDKYIGIPCDYIEGQAGSCFLVDTSGIHKGQLPKSKDRLLMQATFGCTPTKTTFLDPMPIGTDATCNISLETLTPPNDYIARLFVAS